MRSMSASSRLHTSARSVGGSVCTPMTRSGTPSTSTLCVDHGAIAERHEHTVERMRAPDGDAGRVVADGLDAMRVPTAAARLEEHPHLVVELGQHEHVGVGRHHGVHRRGRLLVPGQQVAEEHRHHRPIRRRVARCAPMPGHTNQASVASGTSAVNASAGAPASAAISPMGSAHDQRERRQRLHDGQWSPCVEADPLGGAQRDAVRRSPPIRATCIVTSRAGRSASDRSRRGRAPPRPRRAWPSSGRCAPAHPHAVAHRGDARVGHERDVLVAEEPHVGAVPVERLQRRVAVVHAHRLQTDVGHGELRPSRDRTVPYTCTACRNGWPSRA